MQIIRELEALARGRWPRCARRGDDRAGADDGRAPRRPHGAGREAAKAGPTASSRRSSSIRPSSAPNEDLAAYPRQEAADAELLEAAGCDLLWVPTADAALSRRASRPRSASRASASAGTAQRGPAISTASRRWSPSCCGGPARRRLFGEKDFQQLAVIRRMAADLGARRSRSSACRPCATPTASRCRRAMPI